jgi:uncharacterized protein YheU (UPF0270 family)
MSTYVTVPHAALSEVALEALIEDFITREGTDYGLHEHTLEQKKSSVMRQVTRGEVAIVFDPESESVTLLTREALARALPDGVSSHVDEAD